MSFPFDHHSSRHHHNRRDDDEQDEYRNYPPPPAPFGGLHPPPPPGGLHPPPPYSGPYPPPPYSGPYPPPPPQVTTDVYHTSHNNPYNSYDYPPPPQPQPPVVTIPEHHHGGGSHHFHIPGMSHHSHDPELGDLASMPTYRILSKAGGDRFALAVRDAKVILTYADVNDPTQHWIKDEKYSTKVKDEDGYPSFSLVNKGTKHALKHSVTAHPVQLSHYKPDFFDGSVLWTESKDLGHGYRTIRMVNNTKLVLDAFHGDKDHGGVHDGTIVALYESWKGDNQNQQWKLVPY